MCVALPGKVLKIDGRRATVDFSGNTVEADAGLVPVKPGDNVLVHAGCILQVLSQNENDSLRSLFRELEEL
ncbi:MAG: HypC/HybG/HupF family hydrogenase formation chaperone [Oscillospiraceae bacterium]|jgi:hydrogenase expression/formation protein HypC|nr:HypC/HybG/HupF family hydrogenase formation chaperone [Oscillospiraceae bacterium]MCI1991165.1 HypC/HybG/HupF family hydrogenase formation chaperone [Oscillospiraceae bacterium]MCI2035406.1 HypC/HybG/HupF family hydrogenase formation chaperone [Oscillospiraceae bacterium]